VINRDLGDRLQIAQGLTEADQVIVNPSDGLANGMAITIATPKQNAKG
jgi:hypothetical protein